MVAAFVAEVERRGLGDREAGEEVGLSHEQVRKYRKGEWVRLYPATRRKMRAFLQGAPAAESPAFADGYAAAVERMRAMLAELEATLPRGSPGGRAHDKAADAASRAIEDRKPKPPPDQMGAGGE